jgi:hypothetical protein
MTSVILGFSGYVVPWIQRESPLVRYRPLGAANYNAGQGHPSEKPFTWVTPTFVTSNPRRM